MTEKQEFLSVPEVAKRLNVHRNTVLYWIQMGFIKARKKNPFVSRPQNIIPITELARVEKLIHAK